MSARLKKWAAWLITAAMLLSVIPGTVLAAPPDNVAVALEGTPVMLSPGDTVPGLMVMYTSEPSVPGTTTVTVNLRSGTEVIATDTLSPAPEGVDVVLTPSLMVPVSAPEGLLDLEVIVQNSDGEQSALITGAVDVSNMKVQWTSPVDGDVISGTVPLMADLSGDIDEWSVSVFVGDHVTFGQFVEVLSGTGPVQGHLGDLDTSTYPEGPLTLRLWARNDESGREMEALSFVIVDHTAPQVSLDSILTAAPLHGTVAILGDITEPHLTGWSLMYAPTGTESWVEIASGSGPVSGFFALWDTTVLSDGQYDLRLQASDPFRSGEHRITVSVDNTSGSTPEQPIAVIAFPKAGQNLTNGFHVVGSVWHPAMASWNLACRMAGSQDWVVLETGGSEPLISAPLAYFNPDGLPSGDYELILNVLDSGGQILDYSLVTFHLTRPSGPEVAINYPMSGTVITDPIVDIYGTVRDPNLKSWTLEFSPAGENNWTIIAFGDFLVQDGWLGSWDVSGLAEGTDYVLRLTAVSESGAYSEILVPGLQIQLSAGPGPNPGGTTPTVQITAPLGGSVLSGTVGVYGTVQMAALQEWRLTYRPYAGSGSPIVLASGNRTTSAELLTLWNTTAIPDGQYWLTLTAVDTNGTPTESSIIVSVSNQPLDVKIISPAPGSFVRGIVTISYRISGGSAASEQVSVTGLDYNYSEVLTGSRWDTRKVRDGAYEIRVTATSSAGVPVTAVTTVYVDNTAPDVSGKVSSIAEWITKADDTIRVTPDVYDEYLSDARILLVNERDEVVLERKITKSGSISIPLSGSIPDGIYQLVLYARDEAGNREEVVLKEFGIQLQPPTAPTVELDLTRQNAVTLHWSKDPGYSSVGIKHYRVLRSRAGGPFQEVTVTTNTSWTDTTVKPGDDVAYKVELVSYSGLTAVSTPVSAKLTAETPGGTNPAAGFTVDPLPAVAAKPQVTITWKPLAGARSYDVYRHGPDGSVLVARSISGTSYTDNPPAGAIYTYEIIAHDAQGNQQSVRTNRIVILRQEPQKPPVTGYPILVAVNDRLIGGEVQPYNEGTRTMVPIRFLTEAMGSRVDWDPVNFLARITGKDGTVLTIRPGDSYFMLRSPQGVTRTVMMDVPSVLHYDRTFVPLRFLAEALGFRVEWDQEANLAKVYDH